MKNLVFFVAVVCLSLLPTRGRAQSLHEVNLLHFKSTGDPAGLVTQESAGNLEHLKWSAGGLFSYAYLPLRVLEDGHDAGAVVSHQLLMDLSFAIGLWDRFQLGVNWQAVIYQVGDPLDDLGFSGGEVRAIALSDLRLVPKVVALRQHQYGFGLAFLPILTLPTATSGANAGEPFLSFEPRFVADRRFASGLYVAGSLGYRLRERTQIGNLAVDDEIVFSVGAEYPVLPKISLIAEVFGGLGLFDADGDPDGGIDLEEAPVEALVAGRWRHASGLVVTGGLGRGLTSGYGAPAFRVFVGAGWMAPAKAAPVVVDSDGDGLPDDADKCPNDPEDKNGFEDQDGCPDATKDSDGDGVPDITDKCPKDPEDQNGFEDQDGCPDGAKDSDGDGVPDAVDKCPNEPEDKNGFEDEDGCPDGAKDSDGDGLPDAVDKCPNEPEDKDGFEDEDGCPDPDNDGDGFCDPWVFEKGLQEKMAAHCRGLDKCPAEKEIINGFEDEDGCPDKGAEKAVITKNSIIILDRIYFETDKATLLRQSYPVLDLVVQIMKTHTHIQSLEVQGHTDDVGSDDKNLRLSSERAEAVVKYLVSKGVEPARLTSQGYGEGTPLADCAGLKGARADACRAKNRRVEFKIVKLGNRGSN